MGRFSEFTHSLAQDFDEFGYAFSAKKASGRVLTVLAARYCWPRIRQFTETKALFTKTLLLAGGYMPKFDLSTSVTLTLL